MHSGASKASAHSLQVLGLMVKTRMPSLIELVGQTGLQSPQEIHSSLAIDKATQINPYSSTLLARKVMGILGAGSWISK